jgi:hypothetical protein
MTMDIATKPLGSDSGAHIPEEHATVTAGRDKALIISRNREAQDLITMCSVVLNETTLRYAVAILTWGGCTGKWVVETDGSVR